jgi:Kef-type K+ transport system membrane component KefB
MSNDIFLNIGVIFIISALLGFIAKWLKQPKIPFYVIAGIIIGPFGYNFLHKWNVIPYLINLFGEEFPRLFIQNPDTIAFLAEIGIAFLLFVVGLELSLKKLKDIGLVATLGGTIQVLTVFSSGLAIALLLGFKSIEAAYMGIILAFSSTIVVVKLLVDKKEITTLHSRIIIGILLMQDFFALLVLSSLAGLDNFCTSMVLFSILKIGGFLLFAFLMSKYLFPKIFSFAAKSNELLLLSSLALCFLFSVSAIVLGFSPAIGAFIAGVTLANLPYNIEIIGRVASLRDFFAILFFVSLGLNFSLGEGIALLLPFIIFFFFIIWLKPFIIGLICTLFNYTKSTTFFTSISLAQISEFSLIILGVGYSTLGHISQSTFSLGVLLAVSTMTVSSYFIEYKNKLYYKIAPIILPFRSHEDMKNLQYLPKEEEDYNVILAGVNRVGYSIIRSLEKLDKKALIVDYNPEVIRSLMKKKQPCFYGDIGDPETLERLNFKKVDLVISTVPTIEYNLNLIQKVKQRNKNSIIFVTAEQVDHALELYDKGADYVILPHFLGGEYASILLEDMTKDLNKLVITKLDHIKELNKRKEIGHEHPKQHR